MNASTPAIFLGAFDLLTAFSLIWAMQKITGHAGLLSPDARWALLRRAVYILTATALFALGVGRLSGAYPAPLAGRDDVIWLVSQFVLLLYILIFPVLRATDVITQDRLTVHHRRGHG